MSSITIRNLDPAVKERLRIRAAQHGRSHRVMSAVTGGVEQVRVRPGNFISMASLLTMMLCRQGKLVTMADNWSNM
jgi:hypothetical protein